MKPTLLLRNAAAVGLVSGGLALGAISPATASPADAILYATVQSDYQAPCSYSTNLEWNRAANRLTGVATVDNHLWFEACRKALIVNLVDDEGTVTQITVALETAAGTWDPTAPHRIDQPINQDHPVNRRLAPFIDHMNAEIVDRTR